MKLTTRTALAGAFREYVPSKPVEAPVIVPLTWIEAKATGSPVFASVTVPLTATFCAKSVKAISRVVKTKLTFFMEFGY